MPADRTDEESPLELVSTQDLFDELATRFDGCCLIGYFAITAEKSETTVMGAGCRMRLAGVLLGTASSLASSTIIEETWKEYEPGGQDDSSDGQD